MSKEETADEALRSQLKMARDMKVPFSDFNVVANRLTAKNIRDEELGYFSDPPHGQYDLDQTTRDRLIVNTRQDAAHALLNTITLMAEVRKINRRSWIRQIVVEALCVAAVLALWIWWPRG